MSKIIGIDLGTTNSCVAIIEGSKPKVLENSEGNRTTPSIIAYMKDGEILVGQPAKRQSITNPKNTLFAIKRLMGRKYNDIEIKKDIDIMPYKIISSENGDAWVEVNNKKIAPPQISAEILKKMKKTAEDYLGEKVTDSVITVPAYFNDTQRQATKDAGKIAGLNVRRIINEPTAAALAYGLDKKVGNTIVAVYDLGGGTFDISIIEIDEVDGEKTFEVLSTNGDTHLGGEDFDNKIINYLVNEFKKDYNIDLRLDPLAMQRLKDSSEKAKIELSSTKQTEINLPYITADSTGPKHMSYKITKSKLESLVEDLINKTMIPVKEALKDANLSVDKINDIILVGGQTRMPMVQSKVSNFFGRDVRKDVNPDEAVAIGAAIQGGVLSGNVKDLLLLDVTPLSLGIETIGGIMTTLISKNTTIPTKHSQIFSTAEDNQSAVTIHILQGERKRAVDNKSLGQFNLDGISPALRGIPQIEVTFDIDSDGILHVSAKDKKSGKEQKITIQSSSGLNESEIKNMIREAEENKELDRKFEELIQVKNQGDQILHGTKKQLSELKDKMSKEDIENINNAISKLENSIKGDNKEIIEEDIKKLINLSSKMIELMQKSNEYNDNLKKDDKKMENDKQKNKNEEVSDAEYEEVKK